MIERIGVFAAIGRGYRLTRRQFWRTFGIGLLTVVITAVAAQIITVPFAIVGQVAGLAISDAGAAVLVLVVVNALGTVLSTAFVAPFTVGGDLAAVPRPADAQGGVRRRADDAGGDHRVVSLLLRVLTAEPPLDPSGDEARSLLRRELVHPEYHERNVFEQVLNWIDRLLNGADRRGRRRRRRCRPSPRSSPSCCSGWRWPGCSPAPAVRRARPAGPVRSSRTSPSRAAELRSAAERALAEGRNAEALVDGFRALTVRQVERGRLDDRPGATAHEVAGALATTYPDQRGAGDRQRRALRRGPVRRPAGHPRPGGRRPGARRRPGGSPMSAPTAAPERTGRRRVSRSSLLIVARPGRRRRHRRSCSSARARTATRTSTPTTPTPTERGRWPGCSTTRAST